MPNKDILTLKAHLMKMKDLNYVESFESTHGVFTINRTDYQGFTIDYSLPPVGYYMDVLSALEPFNKPLTSIPQIINTSTPSDKYSWETLVYTYRLEVGV